MTENMIFEMALILCAIIVPLACLIICSITMRADGKMLDETREAIKELDRQSEKFDNIMSEYKKTVRIEVSDSVLDYMKKDREI